MEEEEPSKTKLQKCKYCGIRKRFILNHIKRKKECKVAYDTQSELIAHMKKLKKEANTRNKVIAKERRRKNAKM